MVVHALIKILITGANGFIGRNLAEYLQDSYEVYTPTRQELDLLDEQQVRNYLSQGQFDVIIHTATENATVNGKSNANVLNHNLLMYLNLERSSDYYGQMISFGSGAEYDRLHYQPKMAEDYFGQHIPIDDYGLSKYIISQRIAHKKNSKNLRLFGVYGPYEDWELRFISNAISRTLFDLPIYIKQNVTFDYLHVKDLCKITAWFIDHSIDEQFFNVCTSKTYDLMTLAHMVREVSGKDISIHVMNEGMGKEYSGDNTRLLSAMGSFSFTPIELGISELYAWYDNNKQVITREKLFQLK